MKFSVHQEEVLLRARGEFEVHSFIGHCATGRGLRVSLVGRQRPCPLTGRFAAGAEPILTKLGTWTHFDMVYLLESRISIYFLIQH